jgi:hypothetical protein
MPRGFDLLTTLLAADRRDHLPVMEVRGYITIESCREKKKNQSGAESEGIAINT